MTEVFQLIQSIATGLGPAITVGLAVYSAMKNARVKILTGERDDYKTKHEADRQEIHEIRNKWGDDRLELERLRTETNFAPIDKKLDMHFEAQAKVNQDLFVCIKAVADSTKEQSLVLKLLLEKLVPAITKEQIAEQEKELHET